MSLKHPGSKHFAKLNRKAWAQLRLRIFEHDGWRCRKCGKAGRLECDHIVPLAKGGAEYDPANLQSLCSDCHHSKSRDDAGYGPDPDREAWREFVSQMET